jgi:hypothetical protein
MVHSGQNKPEPADRDGGFADQAWAFWQSQRGVYADRIAEFANFTIAANQDKTFFENVFPRFAAPGLLTIAGFAA